jgi:hypothetical protein
VEGINSHVPVEILDLTIFRSDVSGRGPVFGAPEPAAFDHKSSAIGEYPRANRFKNLKKIHF